MPLISYIAFLCLCILVNSQLVIVENTNITATLGANVTFRWTLVNGEIYNDTFDFHVYGGTTKNKAFLISNALQTKTIEHYGRTKFGNRITGNLLGRLNIDEKVIFELAILDMQYQDSGFFFWKAVFAWWRTIRLVRGFVQEFHPKELNGTIALTVKGPPKFCFGNSTSKSRLSYTICGYPTPKLTWGFNKNERTNITKQNATEMYYATNYSLNLSIAMCNRTLYFKAKGYNNDTLEWNAKPLVHCAPEFCFDNITSKTKLSYTICGLPPPRVTWRFHENEAKRVVQPQSTDLPYAHGYSLSVLPIMCDRTLYFQAVGYRNKTISWNVKPVMNFKLAKEFDVHFQLTENKIKIWWKHVDFGNCSVQYQIEFFHGKDTIVSNLLSSNFTQYVTTNTKADFFQIWAYINSNKTLVTKQTLPNKRKDGSTTTSSLLVVLAVVSIISVCLVIALGLHFLKKRRALKKTGNTIQEGIDNS